MNSTLMTLNSNVNEPKNYERRPTVKVVVINNHKQVLLYNNFLMGGGIENRESIEQAVTRECLEETGAVVRIEKELGTVIQYRDFIKKKYEIFGFLAQLESLGVPSTTQEDEIGKTVSWKTFDEAISFIEQRVIDLEKADKSECDPERYQAKLYNSKTHLVFLKQAKKILGI